jgi:signal transduction histidine kinase
MNETSSIAVWHLSRRFVRSGFSLIAAGVIVVTAFATMQARHLEGETRAIVDNALTGVHFAEELARGVSKKRVLVDDHIFTKQAEEMERTESEIAAVDVRIAETIRAFEERALLPQEGELWQKTRLALNTLSPSIERALELSKQNRDAEAREAMRNVRARFIEVDRDLDELISVKEREAAEGLRQVAMFRRELMLILLGLGGAALIGTLAVGGWVSRAVGAREAENARAARLLELRNRELDAFSGRVAHDLRGPLAAVNLAAQQLEQRGTPGDRATATIRRGVGRMESLVGDLLTLAQVEARVRGTCDPAEIAAHLQDDFAARLKAEKGGLHVSVEHACISCSEGLLQEVLSNLIENAIKYRRFGVAPEISVSGAVRKERYRLSVTDNGIGMSAEDARHIFQPFYRSPETRNVPGTGLGLSIVKRVAEASGGAVGVEAELGVGSTFSVEIPLSNGGSNELASDGR